MNNKYKSTAHQDKHVGVVWVASGLVSWELVMPELDYRNFHCIINIGEPVPLVIHLELEDTESPRSLELVCVCGRILVVLLESHLVVRIEHRELELNIISIKWNPLTSFLFIDIDEVFNVNLPLVVLWIVAVPFVAYLVMSNVVNADHASLAQVPLGHLRAQDIIWRALDS